MVQNNVPVGGFTEGELKFASFWVRHGQMIRETVHWGLIVIVLLTWGYVLWTVLDTYAISYPRESRLTEEMWRNQLAIAGLQSDAPSPIQTQTVFVFPITDGRFDLVVDAENRNAQWWADFSYHFNMSGEQTPRRVGFVMPGSKTVLTELGFRPSSSGGRVAQLVVDEIRWHRVDPVMVEGRYADYAQDRLNIEFQNTAFERITVGTRQVGRTSFDLVNRGAYGYWNLEVVVRAFRGDTMVGINKVTLASVVPGERRHVELQWYETIPPVTKTEIIPIVNLLDPGTYLPTERF